MALSPQSVTSVNVSNFGKRRNRTPGIRFDRLSQGMSVYLFFALALGVTAPSASARVNNVVVEAQVSSRRTISLAVHRSPLAAQSHLGQRPTANSQRLEAPLTGAATPRAPASSR